MYNKYLFPVFIWLIICLSACQSQPEYCTVKGSISGVKDGTKLTLNDEYDHFKVIATTRVKDGSFEFHPCVSAPTHVFLNTRAGLQLKDFFLEPGTIIVDVDATDERDMFTGATGTPSNDLFFKIQQLYHTGENEAGDALLNEVLNAEETGILALYYADGHGGSATQGLSVLDRLSPDIAQTPHATELREVLTKRAKTEPAPEGSDSANYYIDMEFPDVDGNLIKLSTVVNNPINRCVILDFWATWCGPCRESIPELKALYAKYHEKGLEIYSVSEDPKEKNWKSFLPGNGMTWINVRDINAGQKNNPIYSEYALIGIPTMLVIDGETGAILLRDNRQDLENVISAKLQ